MKTTLIKIDAAQPVATLSTTETIAYVGSETLFNELELSWGLHPLHGGKGHPNTRYLITAIDQALELKHSQYKAPAPINRRPKTR